MQTKKIYIGLITIILIVIAFFLFVGSSGSVGECPTLS